MDLAEVGQEKCLRRPAQIVKKNVKFPSDPQETARFIVGSASRSVKIAAVNNGPFQLQQKCPLKKEGILFF